MDDKAIEAVARVEAKEIELRTACEKIGRVRQVAALGEFYGCKRITVKSIWKALGEGGEDG